MRWGWIMPEPTLQTVLQQHLVDYCRNHRLDGQRLKVCRHLLACHTPALGGLKLQCDRCDHHPVFYHGCRDRHCPQCQSRASRRWSQQRQQAVLPVTYYHVVFTLPHALNGWAQLHPKVIYDRLFQCAWTTLSTFAADPKRLNGQLGVTAVLHTWGSNLSQHVHLHCLVPGGALTDNGQWHVAKSTYLFPVKALSRHFRGVFVSALRKAQIAGQLHRVKDAEIDPMLDTLMGKDWVVYSKHCLSRTETVIGYLARYSHRIAISNQRLVHIDEHGVSFRYRDYRHEKQGTLTLTPGEFIRRYLMHVLPKGYMRIRHYGYLANRCREKALNTIRKLLAAPEAKSTGKGEVAATETTYPCPVCHKGYLRVIELIRPQPTIKLQPG
jgi:hypothetical protein